MTNYFVVVGIVVSEPVQVLTKTAKNRTVVKFTLGQPKPAQVTYSGKGAWDIFELTCFDGLARMVLSDVKRRQWLCVTGHLSGNKWYNTHGQKVQRSVQMLATWIDAPAQWRNPWIEDPPSPWPKTQKKGMQAKRAARGKMDELHAIEANARKVAQALPEEFIDGLVGMFDAYHEPSEDDEEDHSAEARPEGG